MNNGLNSFFLETLSSIKQAIYTCHNSLEHISGSNFSLAEFQHYKAVQLGLFQINRICSSAEYLLTHNSYNSHRTYSSYNIDELLDQISSTFCSTVSEYFPVSVKHYTRLDHSFFVQTDERKLELAILQILYCCLKNSSLESFDPINITFYATETKNSIVFHIRDNSLPLNPVITEAINTNDSSVLFASDEISFNAIMAQSVAVVKKAVGELSGKLVYTPLKSGNRFDIYLPKFQSRGQLGMASPAPYIPDLALYAATFAEFKLAFTLDKICKANNETEALE